MTGLLWLNVCMAVGMCLCVFTGALKVSLNLFGYPVIFPAANLIFAFMTFPATDIIADVYGRRAASITVWVGYISQITTVAVVNLLVLLPGDTSALQPFCGAGVRVLAGSSVAYLVAQFWDVYIFHFIKEKVTGEKHLWLRNNLSTMSSQLINSTLFISLVFGVSELPTMLAGSMIVKWLVAALDTPLVYAGCYLLRGERKEMAGVAPSH